MGVVVAFPNVYRLAMSNLGFQAVWDLLERDPAVNCARACLPEPEELAEHRRTRTPWLNLENQRPVGEAEVIAFSLPFENDYPNLLTLLELAGVPLEAAERDEGHPLVIAGGVAPTLNPEPLAPFLDLILVGEAEELLPEFLAALRDLADRPRREMCLELARRVAGVYWPAGYAPRYDRTGLFGGFRAAPGLPRRVIRRRAPEMTSPLISRAAAAESEFEDRALIEVSRGCGRGCRFCAAGFIYRPPRSPDFQALLQATAEAAADFGHVGLVGAAVSDLPGIEEVVQTALDRGASVSLSSLRADTLTPHLARQLAAAGVKTITLAPEAGSQRLRDVVNKGITEADVLEAAHVAATAGIPRLKLYFMIGLPTETDEDAVAVADLVKRIIHHLRATSQGRLGFALITLAVSSFAPKPHTPFQWSPMLPEQELDRRAKIIKAGVKDIKNVKLVFDRPKYALMEAAICRGDRRVGAMLLESHQAGGDLRAAARRLNMNLEFYALRQRGEKERFPWEVVDAGLSRAFLRREYQRAMDGLTSPRCPRPTARACRRCGACDRAAATKTSDERRRQGRGKRHP